MKARMLLPVFLIATLPFLMGADATVQARPPVLQFPPNGWTTDTLSPTLRWQAEGYTEVWVAPDGSQFPVMNVQLPEGSNTITVPTLVGGQKYRWKVRANPLPPGSGVFTWSVWSPEYSFTTIGTLPWQASAVVRPTSPVNGTLASSVTPTLTWQAPAGATHYEMILTPANNEKASIRFVNDIGDTYRIPGPPTWFGMMPDTVYYWRVRVNNATGPVGDDHPSWGPWSDVQSFRTPVPASDLLGPVTPAYRTTVQSATPQLTWSNPNEDVFYYEVQVSKDPNFVTDPARSVAPLYWETLHGGMTTPRNTYQISQRYPLEHAQNYFWRVRAAVPAAGSNPAPWGPVWSFHVD